MQLYDFPFSPNSRKVRAVAYELGIAFTNVNVNLLEGRQRSPEFLALNPNGRVPVLVDGDLVLWESIAIMRYLARGTALLPTDPKVAATHSVLHRARDVIESRVDTARGAALAPEAESVLQRYVRAIADVDVEAMIAIIHDDMHTTMPPSPTWIRGRADNIEFYRRMFARFSGGDTRVMPIGVNGALGCEFHREGALRAVEAIEVRGGRIWRMHHFMQPPVVSLFATARPT